MTQLLAGEQPHVPQDTRLIPLTQGKFAVVDAADYDFLMQWRWSAKQDRYTWYAKCTNLPVRALGYGAIMHRVIMKAPSGVPVDHADHDGLHNWRGNLRLSTRSQNMCNHIQPYKNNKSGFIGVHWYAEAKMYRAVVAFQGVRTYCGVFASAEDAARARDIVAVRLHGEFARLNFPEGKVGK